MDKISCFFGREAYSLENLGFFIIIFTILNPFIVFNPSFFYSVLFYSQILIFYKKKYMAMIVFAIETLFIMRSISVYYIFLNIFLISFFPIIILSSLLFFLFYKFSFAHIFLLPDKLTVDFLEFLNHNNITFDLNLKYVIIISFFILLLVRMRKSALILFFVFIFLQFYPYLIVFDTGHGQSILFNWKGKYILFDGGNIDYRFDITLENFLKLTGKRINTVLISHNDSDHYSGLTKIDKNRFIQNIILPQPNKFIKGDDILHNNEYIVKESFYSLYINRKDSSNRNEYSFFYFLKIFNKKIFFCSDVSASISSEFMSLYNNNSNYIIVGHHGGKGSLSDEIIDKNPDALYIISCSSKYGNPHIETASFLKNTNYLSTRNYGAIFVDPLTGIKISHKK
jgi:competence protein ComEC